MLVLSRCEQERIVIGDNIVITVLRLEGNRVRIGINAPLGTRIVRHELLFEDRSLRAAAANGEPRPNGRPEPRHVKDSSNSDQPSATAPRR